MKFLNILFSKDMTDKRIIYHILGLKFSFKSKSLEEKSKLEDSLSKNSKLLNYFVNPSDLPPAGGELRKRQLIELEILKIIKNVCNENNIQYWLDCGTFLGAVRHKGFIPWDADADVSMTREDYNKIIPLLKEKLKGTDFQLREFYRCRSGVYNYQICICNKGEKEYGVDIFPVDRYYLENMTGEDKKEASEKIVECWEIAQKKCQSDSKFAVDMTKVRSYFKSLTEKYILNNKQELADKPALFWGIDLLMPCSRYRIFEYEKIFPLKEISFEGEVFSCPNNVDNSYLKSYFGENFMKFPKKFKYKEDKIEEYIDSLPKL